MVLTLNLVLAIIALVLAFVAGVIERVTKPALMIAVAVALLAIIHIVAAGGLLPLR